jgi:RNA recognition motif-containing protein
MRLHIRNLHFRVAGDELLSLFSEFGVVTESFVVLDRQTGRSRGFAFLEMPNVIEALTAIECLNDYEWGGRRLFVSEARGRAA